MPKLAKGTRCQCWEAGCQDQNKSTHWQNPMSPSYGKCKAYAVRLVTITDESVGRVFIALCAACAKYHEAKGA